jgi:hypothetical protein
MGDKLDLDQLARIPDPFANDRVAHVPPMDSARRPASPTRQERIRLHAVAAASVLLFEAGWVLLRERRADLALLPALTLVLGLTIPLAACIVSLSAVIRRGSRGLGASTAYAATCAALAPLSFAVATLIAAAPDAERSAFAFWHRALPCVAVTGLLTAAPLAIGMFAFRRAFVAASTWRTAALGVACGALAASTMSLACSDGGALHVVIAHGAMMVFGGIAGALLGPTITRA